MNIEKVNEVLSCFGINTKLEGKENVYFYDLDSKEIYHPYYRQYMGDVIFTNRIDELMNIRPFYLTSSDCKKTFVIFMDFNILYNSVNNLNIKKYEINVETNCYEKEECLQVYEGFNDNTKIIYNYSGNGNHYTLEQWSAKSTKPTYNAGYDVWSEKDITIRNIIYRNSEGYLGELYLQLDDNYNVKPVWIPSAFVTYEDFRDVIDNTPTFQKAMSTIAHITLDSYLKSADIPISTSFVKSK